MDPRSAYMELAALDKQLRELLRANPLNLQAANALRRRLTDAATRLVDAQPAFAAAKEVELALWKPCFYRRIEDFRRRIRKYAAAAQADRNVREHFARVSSEFQQFLTEAAGFYAHLRDVFASWLQHNRQGAKEEDATRCRQSLHRCYVFLGDLARYRELHSQKAKKNFAAAEALYHRALAVLPDNGNPHNQLAVLATYVEAETVAVYRYCRSLLTSQPFTTAEENLALLFERSRQRPLAPPITFTTSSPSSKEKSTFLKSYLHRLTRMHGILFALSSPRGSPTASSGRDSSGVTPLYPRDMEAVLFKDMRTLLHAGVVGDALLLKLVVTNIFCTNRASDSRLQSAPREDALRLSIRTITSVMEFLLNSLDIKPKQSANGKTVKDSALPSLRLAGPVTVFCDFLKLHPDMLEQLEQLLVHRQKKLYSDVATNEGSGADLFASTFLETLAKLVNHARIRELYAPLVASAKQQYDSEIPSAVREQQSLLKESLELRGFTPLDQVGTASTWQDEWALQTSTTGANSASQVAPLADDEAARIRAWKLYHFARYLCDGYEGDPLLFCGPSGQFTTAPVIGSAGPQHGNSSGEAFGSFNLGFLSSNTPKQKHTQPQGTSTGDYRASTTVDDDDDFDDEVIVFQPSPALRGMSGRQPSKQHGGLMAHAPTPLDTLSSGGSFSLRAPSPISPAEELGRTSASSQSTTFGATANGSIGSSLGYPSFDTFNDVNGFSSQSLLSGWGNSTSSSSNGNSLTGNLGLGSGMLFSSDNNLNAGFAIPSAVAGDTNNSQPPGFGSRIGQSQSFAPMVNLAAVERESALYQQRTSSLSAFMGSSAPSTQTDTQDPSPPRMPKRPPPGFGAASMGGEHQLPTSFVNP